MKPLRLLALAIAATAWCASAAFACDGAKASAASAASCGTKSASVKTASADACGSKSTATTAVAASASKKGAHAANAACPATPSCPAGSDACKAMMAAGACTAEMQAACATKGAKATKTAGMDCCATGAKGAKTAAADGCGMHAAAAKGTKTAGADCCATGAKSAKTAGADGCSMHSMAGHGGMDCVVCADEMACDDEVKATGARAQVVPLRNGSMIVYMLESDENVRGLQAAVARHNGRVVAALQGDSKLCTACKKLRGALASGKLVREVVNVERGCQVLITSSDRSIVEQVHRCTNAQVAARTKS